MSCLKINEANRKGFIPRGGNTHEQGTREKAGSQFVPNESVYYLDSDHICFIISGINDDISGRIRNGIVCNAKSYGR